MCRRTGGVLPRRSSAASCSAKEMRRVAREFTQAEADRHNALTAKGWALTKGRLVLHGEEPSGRPGWYTRWQLHRAARCFERALAINPEGWSSMWALGK